MNSTSLPSGGLAASPSGSGGIPSSTSGDSAPLSGDCVALECTICLAPLTEVVDATLPAFGDGDYSSPRPTSGLGCQGCSVICHECLWEVHSRSTSSVARCDKCHVTYNLSALMYVVGIQKANEFGIVYVTRELARVNDEARKDLIAYRAAAPIKAKVKELLRSKLGETVYYYAINFVRTNTSVGLNNPIASVVWSISRISAVYSEADLRIPLEVLDTHFECQDFTALLEGGRLSTPRVVKFACPHPGCVGGVGVEGPTETSDPASDPASGNSSDPASGNSSDPASGNSSDPASGTSACEFGHLSCLRCRASFGGLEAHGEARASFGGHGCREEDLVLAKTLEETTKACPKCYCPVEKTEGCDHMWCVKCGTGFDWVTLKITQTSANPHFYESVWANLKTQVILTEEISASLLASGQLLDDGTPEGQACYETFKVVWKICLSVSEAIGKLSRAIEASAKRRRKSGITSTLPGDLGVKGREDLRVETEKLTNLFCTNYRLRTAVDFYVKTLVDAKEIMMAVIDRHRVEFAGDFLGLLDGVRLEIDALVEDIEA